MKILYVAAGIPVPGTVGGSTHVVEVCRGLAARGHRLLAVAGPHPDSAAGGARRSSGVWELAGSDGRVIVANSTLPKGLSLGLLPAIERLGAAFQPDVVMERYYNFAGAGLIYAKRHGLGALLEVNAPLYDPPGTTKDRLDRALGRPLRRWAAWQARAADRIVTPLATTAGKLARSRQIVEAPWGANTDLFDRTRLDPQLIAATRAALGIPPGAPVVAFAGSFRPWHGVDTLLDALRELLPARSDLHALLIGDGEERPALVATTRGWGEAGARVHFTGRLSYDEVPRHLAAADIGVAPFQPARHPALRHFGFYWSPLKIFEYGAMELPTVCPAIPPLDRIIRDGREGRLYREGDRDGLIAALAALLDDPAGRRRMGLAARDRVVSRYSWAAHCRTLNDLLHQLSAERGVRNAE